MQEKKIYTINSAKLHMAYIENFKQEKDSLVMDDSNTRHVVILNRFRSYESETKWGRFKCKVKLSSNNSLRILALASDGDEQKAVGLNDYFHNPNISWVQKRAYFEQSGYIFANHQDVLLYNLTGEYLWIAIEIDGMGSDRIYDMKLDSQGDNFMQTFPEIYQDEGGYFHRYMSIFSSIYQDMYDKLNSMDRYLDIDTTPMSVLINISSWLGFDTGDDFLDEEMLRRFVGRLYSLNRIKGTKRVMKEIVEVILGTKAIVMERNKMENHIPTENKDTYKRLYGDTINDVVILVRHKEDEKLQAQMMVILDEFKPVRSRIRLVFAENNINLDSYCYMDYNASLDKKKDAAIDGKQKMNGTVILQ